MSIRTEFDAYAEHYPEELSHVCRRLVDPADNYFIRLKCEALLGLIGEWGLSATTLTVADVGCGVGGFERFLRGCFGRLVACDISMGMLRQAAQSERWSGLGYFCSDAQALPLPDACADLVFASCLFHHMHGTTLTPVLRELRRVCRPGGYVVCFEHNPLHPVTQLVIRTTPLDRDAHLLPAGAMVSAYRQTGLEVAACRFILFAPESLDRRLRKLDRWLSRIPLGGQYLVAGRKME